jgi:hypothetical protein
MPRVSSGDAVIVTVCLPSAQAVLFQGILNGEDGLAVMRSLDANDRSLHELWTVPDQLPELYGWLATLPSALKVRIVDERPYR